MTEAVARARKCIYQPVLQSAVALDFVKKIQSISKETKTAISNLINAVK